mmetsp:Transcript_41347/g.101879  ORF Transcript_41347/g.101879 Transcript_41347/m.101879 type:complete len:220 (-) Transcript_41347:285-944(-)
MGLPFNISAVRRASFLSRNSTHPSVKFLPVLPPNFLRRSRMLGSSGVRYMRSSAPYGVSSCRSFIGFMCGGMEPRYTTPRRSWFALAFSSAFCDSTFRTLGAASASSSPSPSPSPSPPPPTTTPPENRSRSRSGDIIPRVSSKLTSPIAARCLNLRSSMSRSPLRSFLSRPIRASYSCLVSSRSSGGPLNPPPPPPSAPSAARLCSILVICFDCSTFER